METKLYAMISCLADNHGFDADEAFEYVRWETDVDHVGEILALIGVKEEKKKTEEKSDTVSEAPTESTTGGDVHEKIAVCKKNISLWEKKLADGKCKDADKQEDKIRKEKAKLIKLEAKAGPVVPAPPKVEPKKEEAKAETKKADTKEKRIKRFSPVMASQLKTALEGVGLEMGDKIKKEFQQYIEDLTDDDYRASGLADHMRAFAKLKAPAPEKDAEESEVEELTKEIDEIIKEDPPAPPVETKKEAPAKAGPPKIIDVTLDDLRMIKMIAEIDTPGTYWDADNGRFVKGPASDEDEDFEDTKFNGKTYTVGDKTRRVYLVENPEDEENYKTIFAGFLGVGKFKDMTVTA